MPNNEYVQKYIIDLQMQSANIEKQYLSLLNTFQEANREALQAENKDTIKTMQNVQQNLNKILGQIGNASSYTAKNINNPAKFDSIIRRYAGIGESISSLQKSLAGTTMLGDKKGQLLVPILPKDVESVQQSLVTITNTLAELRKVTTDSTENFLLQMDFTENEIKQIKEEINSGKSLNEILKEELHTREKIYESATETEKVLKENANMEARKSIDTSIISTDDVKTPSPSMKKNGEILSLGQREKEQKAMKEQIADIVNSILLSSAHDFPNPTAALESAFDDIKRLFFNSSISEDVNPFGKVDENSSIEDFFDLKNMDAALQKIAQYQQAYNSFTSQINKAQEETKKAAQRVQVLQQQYQNEVSTDVGQLGSRIQDEVVDLEDANAKIKEVDAAVQQTQQQLTAGEVDFNNPDFEDQAVRIGQSVNSAAQSVQNLTGEELKADSATENLAGSMKDLDEKTKDAKQKIDQMDTTTKRYNDTVKKAQGAQSKAGFSLNSIGQKEIKNVKDLAVVAAEQYWQPQVLLQSMIQMISSAVSQLKQLDTALSNIAMVTNYTMQDMWNYYDQYAEMATELGQSIQDVVDASALYYQQGLDTVDVMNLTRETMKLATLGGIDFSEATSEITAALRGFNMEMSEASNVVDVYSNLAANAAATVEQISTAMMATASIAANAGMSYENTAAYLTKMIETTQESASSVGTSMKTIIANFTQMKENVSSDDADAELSINSVEDALKSVGISLRDSMGQIKDLDDVIDELGMSWADLDRNTQRYLGTTIAGTRQQSRLIALLDDYDRTLELEKDATDAAGQSDAQFAKYTDTLAYSSQRLSTQLEELKQKFVTDNIVSKAMNAFSSLLTGLNNMPTGVISALGVGLLFLGKKIITSILDPIRSCTAAWKEMSKQMKEKHEIKVEVQNVDKSLEGIKDFIQEAQKYAEKHSIKVKTEIISDNPQPEFWKSGQQQKVNDLKTQREEVAKYSEDKIKQARSANNESYALRLEKQRELALKEYDKQISENQLILDTGISAERDKQVQKGQEQVFQLTQNKIESLYQEDEHLLKVLSEGENTLSTVSVKALEDAQAKLRESIRELEAQRDQLLVTSDLATTSSFDMSRKEIIDNFTTQAKAFNIPNYKKQKTIFVASEDNEYQQEIMKNFNKLEKEEIFSDRSTNSIALEDLMNQMSQQYKDIQTYFNLLDNLEEDQLDATVHEKKEKIESEMSVLQENVDKLFDDSSGFGSLLNGLDNSILLVFDEVDTLYKNLTSIKEDITLNTQVLSEAFQQESEQYLNDFNSSALTPDSLSQLQKTMGDAGFKIGAAMETYVPSKNAYSEDIDKISAELQKNDLEMKEQQKKLIEARKKNDEEAIQEAQNEIKELDQQAISILNDLQKEVVTEWSKEERSVKGLKLSDILSPIVTAKSSLSDLSNASVVKEKSTVTSSQSSPQNINISAKVEVSNNDNGSSQKSTNKKEEQKQTKKNAKSTTNITGEASEFWTTFGQLAKQTMTQTLTMVGAIVAEISGGAKASTVAVTGFVSILTMIVPMIAKQIPAALTTAKVAATAASEGVSKLSLAIKSLATSLGPILALGVALAVLVSAVSFIVKKYNDWKTSTLEYKIEALTDDINELADAYRAASNSAQEATDTSESLTDALETYQTLSKKAALTSEEQSAYEEAVNVFRNSYPELVRSYDSVTGELEIWTSETEKQVKSLQEEAQQAQNLAHSLKLAESYGQKLKEDYEIEYQGYSSEESNVVGTTFQVMEEIAQETYPDATEGEQVVLGTVGYERKEEVTSGRYLSSEEMDAMNKLYNSYNEEYDDLIKNNRAMQNLLNELGITSSEEWEYFLNADTEEMFKTDIYSLEQILSSRRATEIDGQNYLDEYEKQSKAFDTLLSDFNELSLYEVEKLMDVLSEVYDSQNLQAYLVEILGKTDYNNITDLPNFIEQYLTSPDIIESLSMGTLAALSNNINSLISNDYIDSAIVDYFDKVMELGLSDEQLNSILSFSWDNYDSSFSALSPFVDTLTALGMSEAEAKEMYHTILTLQEQSGVYTFKINTSIGITTSLSDFRDELEDAVGEINTHLNIVDVAFSDDAISISDLNSYRDSLMDAGYNDADWWDLFYFNGEGEVELDYNAIGDLIQQTYDNEFTQLESNRRDMYQGMLDLEHTLAEMDTEDQEYEMLKQQYEEMRQTYEEIDWDKEVEYLNFSIMDQINAELEDEEEDIEDLADDLADAEDSLADAIDALRDAIDELNETLYGTSNRKSSLDTLYNYSTAIDVYTTQASRLLDTFTDTQDVEEAIDTWQSYAGAQHNTMAEQKAEQEVIQQGLANLTSWFNTATSTYEATYEAEDENGVLQTTTQQVQVNYSDYVSFDESTGRMQIDQQLVNQAEFNDEFKDLLEQNVEDYNTYAAQLEEIDQSIYKEEKEMQDKRIEVLTNYGELESNVANVLKSQYQEEVDALSDKYSAMKEADDDYLTALQDAIDKQRELRDLENSYEDVAKQERKLSLMERDTSGARRTEVLEAQEDLEESRQDLLDEAVDNILDNMEENNENLSEIRDIEIEIKQAILDDNAYWNKMAESIVGSFSTVEDYAEWMVNNDSDYLEATTVQQETLLIQYMDDANAIIQKWAIEQSNSIEDYCVITGTEIQELVEKTGEAFTSETERSFNETTEAVKENIENAVESIKDAQESVDDAREALLEAEEAYNDATVALDEFREAIERLIPTLQSSTDSVEEEGYVYAKGRPELSNEGMSTPFFDYNLSETRSAQAVAEEEGYNLTVLPEENKLYLRVQYSDGKFQTLGPFEDFDEMEYLENVIEHRIQQGKISDVVEMFPWVGEPNEEKYSDYMEQTGKTLTYAFASGGIVDFTGPAWVDGTKSKPEAFLSAEDTERIGRAAEIFANIPLLNSSSIENLGNTTSYGDTSIEINLNVDSISSDVDIEYMLDRMKDEIVSVATPERSNVILRKNYK